MDSLEDVLKRVADGELSPAEALAAIDEPDAAAPGVTPAPATAPADPAPWPDDPWTADDDEPPTDLDAEPWPDDDEAGAGDEAPTEEETATAEVTAESPEGPVDLAKEAPPADEAGDATAEPVAYPGLGDTAATAETGEPDEPERERPGRPRGRPRRGRPGRGAPPPPSPGDERLRVVRLRLPARSIDVYADPTVAEVHVSSGSPVLRRQGDALIVESAAGRHTGSGARFAFVGHLPRTLAAAALDECIVVRINPELQLDVDASAVSLRVWGCEGGLRLRLAASSAKLSHISGPVSFDVMSSSVKGSVRLTGRSRIRCESSSVKLGLLSGSDVQIRSRNRMGKVVLPRRRSRNWIGEDESTTAVVGKGRGRLTVDATMSSVMLGGAW